MALGPGSVRATSAAWLSLACLYALLCLCAASRPEAALDEQLGEKQLGEKQPDEQPSPSEGPVPVSEQPAPDEQPLERPPLGEGPMPVWVFFVNFGEKPLDLHWLGEESRHHQEVLLPHQLIKINTHTGHDFEVAERHPEQEGSHAATPARVEIRVVEDNPGTTAITKFWACERREEGHWARASIACSLHELEYKGGMWDQQVDHMNQTCNNLLQKHPEDAAHFCSHDYAHWSVAQCIFDTSPEEFSYIHAQKLQKNHDNVLANLSHVKKFTKTGHKVSKVPAKLFKALQKHWSEDRLKLPRPENQPRFSAVVPGCKSDTWMMHIGEAPELQKQVIDTLQPLVAKWAGLKADEIEFVQMYGIRMYRHGSSFALHRDIRDTHVLSAILEIGQLELDHPDPTYNGNASWPLHIQDHNGTLHTHEYKPGQMIIYESYTCPHGRPKPFEGREIASLFVHYRPVGWGPKDWDPTFEPTKKSEL